MKDPHRPDPFGFPVEPVSDGDRRQMVHRIVSKEEQGKDPLAPFRDRDLKIKTTDGRVDDGWRIFKATSINVPADKEYPKDGFIPTAGAEVIKTINGRDVTELVTLDELIEYNS